MKPSKSILILHSFLWSLPLFAALPANTTWEVRNAGNDSNGGGFVTGASGTDFSQQNAAQYTFTDLASVTGTTNPCIVTSASHSFVASDVGNIMQVTAGTNWTPTFHNIVSVAAGAATLDTTCGSNATLTGGTYAVGGALKTLTKLSAAFNTTSNVTMAAWVKADSTYTVAVSNSLSPTCNTNGCSIQVSGYTTTRGDNGKPTFQASAGLGNYILNINNNNNLQDMTIRNFLFDCNSQSNTGGLQINANQNIAQNIEAKNCTSYGVALNGSGGGGAIGINIYAHNNPGSSSLSGGILLQGGNLVPVFCFVCTSVANGATGTNIAVGFNIENSGVCFLCMAGNNTGATAGTQLNVGFYVAPSGNNGPIQVVNSVSYGNSGDGIRFPNAFNAWVQLYNNVIYGNGKFGINSTTTTFPSGSQPFNYNFYGSNTSGNLNNVVAGANDVTLTADPFTNGAGNVFQLNNTSGGGAAVKAAGFPGTPNAGGIGFISGGALMPTTSGGAVGFGIVQ